MLNLIKELSELYGPSSYEDEVREYIKDKLNGKIEYRVDTVGNIIALHKGKKPSKKLALFAHMDEVSVIITHVDDEGFIKFSSIGIDSLVLFGRRLLIGDNRVRGIIGAKEMHSLSDAELESELKSDDLYIDIGATTKEQALEVISLGDFGIFDEEFTHLGEHNICAKALDDRVGCAILLTLLSGDFPYEFTGVFTCKEETGLQGAQAAAHNVRPELALVLETTTAGDIGAASANEVCRLSKGAVVSYADKGALYDRKLFKLAFEIAEKNGISIQTKEGVFGGNESRAIISAGDGCAVCAVSVPCRYLHSGSCVADMRDIESTLAIAGLLIKELCVDD